MKDNTAHRLNVVETTKLSLREFNEHVVDDERKHVLVDAAIGDHETRIRWLERSLYIGFGIVIILQTALSVFGSKLVALL